MSQPSFNPEDMVPLSDVMYGIIVALSSGEMHGYAIMKEIEAMTNNKLSLSPTTLYRNIRTLKKDGLLEEVPPPPGEEAIDERRRYYKLTALGRKVGRAHWQYTERLNHKAQEAFGGAGFALLGRGR